MTSRATELLNGSFQDRRVQKAYDLALMAIAKVFMKLI